MLSSPVAGHFLYPEKDDAVVRNYLADPGATRRTSRRKQDLSIWLNAFSRSVPRRRRPSSLLWLWH